VSSGGERSGGGRYHKIQSLGVKAREQEFRRTQCFLGCMLACVAFGCTLVSLTSMRWSVFDAPCSSNTTQCEGYIGLYRYDIKVDDNETLLEAQGRINNAASTALCNVITYNQDRDLINLDRNDCDRYLDAADNGSTLGIAAAVVGIAACVWAGSSAMAETEEESPLHQCFLCPRLLTAAPVMALIASVCALLSSGTYARARPGTPNFFLDSIFNYNGTNTSNASSDFFGNGSNATGELSNASTNGSSNVTPSHNASSNFSNSTGTGELSLPSWELGLAVYLMLIAGIMYFCAMVTLLMARRYNAGSKMANARFSAPLIVKPAQMEVTTDGEEHGVLEVWEGEITEDAEERRRSASIPNFDAGDSLETSLLSQGS